MNCLGVSNRRCFTTVVVLSVTLFALLTAHVYGLGLEENSSLYKPITAQPLSMASVLADTNHVLSVDGTGVPSAQKIQTLSNQLSQLFTLSKQDVQITSISPPISESQQSFFPFGRHMSMSFQLPNDSEDGLLSENSYDFVLEVDQAVTSTDPEAPSYSATAPTANGAHVVNYYHKHTNYKGTRINQNGQEEVLLVTITPTSTPVSALRPGLETQSLDKSGGYTVHAYFLAEDKLFEITTYESLLQQLTIEHASAERAMAAGETGLAVQASMNILSSNMATLASQRLLAANDLLIRELSTEDDLTKRCGVIDDAGNISAEIDHYHVEETSFGETPISAKSLWQLSLWPKTCHSRMHTYTIFTIRFWFTTRLRLWASGLDPIEGDESLIDNSKAEAVAKSFQQINNHVTASQFRVLLSIKAYVHAPSTNQATWNDEVTCNFGEMIKNLGSFRSVSGDGQPLENDQIASVDHMLCKCSREYAGLAYVGVFCGKGGGAGVSAAYSMGSWTILLHEVGHQMNGAHTDLGGTMGGGSIAAGEYGTPKDQGRNGFSWRAHQSDICPHMDSRITGHGALGAGNCWKEPATQFTNMCENDGILKSWQQCQDGSNACCQNCKFKAGTTCTTPHPQCCVNCKKPTGPAFCEMNGDPKGGYCTAAGTCKSTTCTVAQNEGRTAEDIFIAPTNTLESFKDACEIFCWETNSSGVLFPGTRGARKFSVGDTCTTLAGQQGVCLSTNTTIKSTGLLCTPLTETAAVEYTQSLLVGYTWEYYVFTTPVCSPRVDLVDSYVCRDNSGNPVPDSMCEKAGVEKPSRFEFDCSSTITNIVVPESIDRQETVTILWKYTKGPSIKSNETVTITVAINDLTVATVGLDLLLTDEKLTFTLPNVAFTHEARLIFTGSTGLRVVSPIFGVYSYVWDTTSPWSGCSATFCGPGVKTRVVFCRRDDMTVAPESHCANLPAKPAMSQTCSGGNCGENGVCVKNACVCNPGYINPGSRCNSNVCTTCRADWSGTCTPGVDHTCPCDDAHFGPTCMGNKVCSTDDTAQKPVLGDRCLNGGWMQQATSANPACLATTRCVCQNKWVSSNTTALPTAEFPGCDVCSITCTAGKPNTNCSGCICPKTKWSQTCQCNQLPFSLQLLQYPEILSKFSTSGKFEQYLVSKNYNATIAADVSGHIGKIQNLFVSIAKVNILRIKIDSWAIVKKSLIVNARVFGLCATDTTINNFSKITDTIKEGYTEQEQLYAYVDAIIQAFKKYEEDKKDNFGLGLILQDPAKSAMGDKELNDKVIDNPDCDEEQMTSGVYTCDLPKGNRVSYENNSASAVNAFLVSLSVIAILFLAF